MLIFSEYVVIILRLRSLVHLSKGVGGTPGKKKLFFRILARNDRKTYSQYYLIKKKIFE